MKTILMSLIIIISNKAYSLKLIAESGQSKVQLLELYSSESCSSCPPADLWISNLVKQPDLWKKYVPIVLHVDYWNHLSWKDEYSSEKMTERQIAITKLWPKPSVYTPSFIVDGKEWANWREAVNYKLPTAEKATGLQISIFEKSLNTYLIKIKSNHDLKEKYLIYVAELGMNLKTNVKDGENSGKNLVHNFLILDLQSKFLNEKTFDVEFTLNSKNKKTDKRAIAAWVEAVGRVTPLQATGAYL